MVGGLNTNPRIAQDETVKPAGKDDLLAHNCPQGGRPPGARLHAVPRPDITHLQIGAAKMAVGGLRHTLKIVERRTTFGGNLRTGAGQPVKPPLPSRAQFAELPPEDSLRVDIPAGARSS